MRGGSHIALVAGMVGIASSLSACVSSTAYHPAITSGHERYGYTDTLLQPNLAKVSFAGNEYTSVKRVDQLAMKRAAELALNNGYDYFGVLKKVVKWQRVATNHCIPLPATDDNRPSSCQGNVEWNKRYVIDVDVNFSHDGKAASAVRMLDARQFADVT